jgi:periplasmic protein TonB
MERALKEPERFATFVGQADQKRGWVWPVTVVLHGLAAAAVVILPLLGDEPLPPPGASVTRAFFVAPVFAPAPPPPPPAPRPAAAARVAPREAPAAFTAPVEIPDSVTPDSALDILVDQGVPGGEGVPGGVVGGVLGGLGEAPPPPPTVVRVGGQVHEPRKLKHVAPVYPSVARVAKIQGTVILQCLINAQGRVDNVELLRGVPMLDEAAVEAVKQWVYTPTLVGGVPVAVVMTVTVSFVLHQPKTS